LISSNSSVPANRTFSLTSPTTGQIVVLVFAGANPNTCRLTKGSSYDLIHDWEPFDGDSISLVYNGTKWLETNRASRNSVQIRTVASDEQEVYIGTRTSLEIRSDSATATNRTFVLENGRFDGQPLTLIFTEFDTNRFEIVSAGNAVLSATWSPTTPGSLSLIWSASATSWIETGRF